MSGTYTIQVSNHHGAGSRIPTEDAAASWSTIYDGPIATAELARSVVDDLARKHCHARAFRGGKIGRLWYAVLRADGAKKEVRA